MVGRRCRARIRQQHRHCHSSIQLNVSIEETRGIPIIRLTEQVASRFGFWLKSSLIYIAVWLDCVWKLTMFLMRTYGQQFSDVPVSVAIVV